MVCISPVKAGSHLWSKNNHKHKELKIRKRKTEEYLQLYLVWDEMEQARIRVPLFVCFCYTC